MSAELTSAEELEDAAFRARLAPLALEVLPRAVPAAGTDGNAQTASGTGDAGDAAQSSRDRGTDNLAGSVPIPGADVVARSSRGPGAGEAVRSSPAVDIDGDVQSSPDRGIRDAVRASREPGTEGATRLTRAKSVDAARPQRVPGIPATARLNQRSPLKTRAGNGAVTPVTNKLPPPAAKTMLAPRHGVDWRIVILGGITGGLVTRLLLAPPAWLDPRQSVRNVPVKVEASAPAAPVQAASPPNGSIPDKSRIAGREAAGRADASPNAATPGRAMSTHPASPVARPGADIPDHAPTTVQASPGPAAAVPTVAAPSADRPDPTGPDPAGTVERTGPAPPAVSPQSSALPDPVWGAQAPDPASAVAPLNAEISDPAGAAAQTGPAATASPPGSEVLEAAHSTVPASSPPAGPPPNGGTSEAAHAGGRVASIADVPSSGSRTTDRTPIAPPENPETAAAPSIASLTEPGRIAVPAPPIEPGAPTASEGSETAIPLLLQRGDAAVAIGDIAGARQLYERAATLGSADGARSMGKTYDAEFLRHAGVHGFRADRAVAKAWFHKAFALGEPKAHVVTRAKPAAPAQASPDDKIRALLQHGDAAVAAGDVVAARPLYERAAALGSAAAATAAGKTYDIEFVLQAGGGWILADPAAAAAWFHKAAALGDPEARERLARLKAQTRP